MKKLLLALIFVLPIMMVMGQGESIVFDGDDDYVYANSPWATRDGSSTFSITAWINPSFNLDPGDAYEIVSITDNSGGDGDAATDYAGFRIDEATFTLQYGIDNGQAWTSVSGNTVLTAGNWYHVAVVVNGTDVNFYVNGINDGGGTIAERTLDGLDIISVGAYWLVQGGTETPVVNDYFEGEIDEVAIFDDLRLESEIRTYMSQGLTVGSEPDLLAYYKFNNDVTDETTNYNGNTVDTDASLSYTASTAFNTWLGGTDDVYTETANWSRVAIPVGESVGFYSGAANYPQIEEGASFRNLFIENEATPTFAGNFTASGNVFVNNDITLPSDDNVSTIAGDLTIAGLKTVIVNAGHKLTVSGDLNIDNAGQITLRSPYSMAGAPASLITEGSINNSGFMTMQRYLTGGTVDDLNWHSIGSPIDGATAAIFSGNSVLEFDESINNWSYVANTGTALTSGVGFLVKALNGNRVYSFTGEFNNGDISITNLANTAATGSGYHMVSNPYPSLIDLHNLTLGNVAQNFWAWDPVAENYRTYDSGTEAGTLSRYIQPSQAFFVYTATGSGSVGFSNVARTHTATNSTFLKSSKVEVPKVYLTVSDGNLEDQLYIYDLDVDNYGYKMFSMSPETPQIFIKSQGKNYQYFKLRNGISEELTIPIGFTTSKSGEYSIKASDITIEGYDIILEDSYTNTKVILDNNTEYTFDHSANNEPDRFMLKFASAGSTGIEKDRLQESQDLDWYDISPSNSGIQVTLNDTPESNMRIYDILGSLILDTSIERGVNVIEIEKNGIYIIKLSSELGINQEKFIFSR